MINNSVKTHSIFVHKLCNFVQFFKCSGSGFLEGYKRLILQRNFSLGANIFVFKHGNGTLIRSFNNRGTPYAFPEHCLPSIYELDKIEFMGVGGNRWKERDRKSELVLRSTYQIFEWDRNNSDRNFYNVVRYVHIPLVP